MSTKKVLLKKEKNNIVKDTNQYIPLGVFYFKNKIVILEKSDKVKKTYSLSFSNDGENFDHDSEKVIFSNGFIYHKPSECSDFRFSNFGKKIYASYVRTVKTKKYRVIAESSDMYEWEVVSETLSLGFESVILQEEKINKNYVMYEGGIFAKCLISKDLEKWNDNDILLFTNRPGYFDAHNIKLVGSVMSEKGIVLFYESFENEGENYRPCIGAVFFDKNDPYRIIWRSENPVWKSDIMFSKITDHKLLGMFVIDGEVSILWSVDDNIVFATLDKIDSFIPIYKKGKKILNRHHKNPVIKPHEKHEWESEAVFNPATVADDHGHIHLLYRAVGSDGVSRLGYDFSKDGINFNGRLTYPVFVMTNPRKLRQCYIKQYNISMYPSGGSWGGCEDPRMVRIDGRIYVTFNAFDGWDFIRIGVISIDEKDFFNKKWNWSKPLLISPPNQINKNWVLFPEKINGKFAILHSISPKVMVDYVDRLEDLDKEKKTIKSHFAQDKTKIGWDSWVRGVGPPPIKTDKGWLVMYHAMDHRDPNKYKLGAILLDIKDPSKVLGRSDEPLLMPDMWYENDWKPGVVYACGAIIKNNTLFVYYGGGDKYVCVATSPLEKVLDKLVKKLKVKS
jgi:predicted GH43/DUF377 family glycosyl hydrolase